MVRFVILISLVICIACNQNQTAKTSELNPSNKVQESASRFNSEINAFIDEDDSLGVQNYDLILTGSSSIRMWTTMEEDLSPFKVLNRGFGGATIAELNNYAPRFLFSNTSRCIILYCGENDIHEGASPEIAFQRFKEFYKIFRSRSSDLPFIYINMKPSISRWTEFDDYQRADSLIVSYLESDNNAYTFDPAPLMLDSLTGKPRTDIFIEDGLHMNELGYDLWASNLMSLINSIIK